MDHSKIIGSKKNKQIQEFFYKMLLIRRFEEKILSLFSKGLLSGTTHAYIGQEANGVGIIANISESDIIFSNHRCHGHYLAFTDDVEGLLRELMGKNDGICGGRGGSQHLNKGNFYTNGIQGGIVPCATGMAYAEKIKGSGCIAVVFMGDGTLGQGVVYESLNFASLWSIPILFVLENNEYAQSTYYKKALAGSILKRAESFGIDAMHLSTTDVFEIHKKSASAITYVKTNIKPFFLLIDTYRFCHHSASDDFRPREEIEERGKNDPLNIFDGLLENTIKIKIEADIVNRINNVVLLAAEENFGEIVL